MFRRPFVGLIALIIANGVGCDSGPDQRDDSADTKRVGLQNPLPHPLMLKNQSNPLIDVRRNAISHTLVSNFQCNSYKEKCLPNAVLFTNRNWGDTSPGNWQPNQLLMATDDGLRDRTERLYTRGDDLFEQDTVLAFGNSLASCAGDFDHDGYNDIFVVNKAAPHRLYLNRGHQQPGYFDDRTADLHEKDSQGFDLADPNNHDFGNDQLSSWSKYNPLAFRCTTGDINGDGYDDIVVSHSSFITTNMLNGRVEVGNPRTLQVFINDPQNPGVFRDESRSNAVIPVNPMSRVGAIKLFDMDGDGDQDLILGSGYKNVDTPPGPAMILINNGQGVFATSRTLANSDGWSIDVETAVIDNRPTVFLINRKPPHRVFQHVRMGRWQFYQDISNSVFGVANDVWGDANKPYVASGRLQDLNGDGRLDLVTVGADVTADIHAFVASQGSGFVLQRKDGLFVGSLGSVREVNPIDANNDGILEVLISRVGFSDVWVNSNGIYQAPSAFPAHGNMDGHGDIGDADGDGFLDYLEPGYRNFHQSFMVKRNLPNQYYLNQPKRFKDVSSRLPQPQLDNFKDCRDACRGAVDENECMERCDMPEKCVQRCTQACGLSVNAQSDCLNACSWDRVRHRQLGSHCVARCNTDCAIDCDVEEADAEACALQAVAGYCGAQGSCINQCEAVFDLDKQAWQRFYKKGAYKGWRATVIEETSGQSFVDYDGDGDKDIIVAPSFQPPYLLTNKGNGFYTLFPQKQLPCRTAKTAAPVVADLNGDGRDDIVLYTKWLVPTIWYSRGPNVIGPQFSQRNINIVNWAGQRLQKFYSVKPIDANNDGLTDLAITTSDLDRGTIVPALLINLGGAGSDFRLQRVVDNAGQIIGAACRNHQTGLIGPCVGVAPGATIHLQVADIDQDGRDDIITSVDVAAVPASADNGWQTQVGLLLLNRSNAFATTFGDYSRHLHYDLYDGRFFRATDDNNMPVYGVRMRGTVAADFDKDKVPDVLVSDFQTPVFLKNLGPKCWIVNNAKCLVDRTLEMFGSGHQFDGKYGAKNYGLLAADFNNDGVPGFILRSAGENIWYEAGKPRQ